MIAPGLIATEMLEATAARIGMDYNEFLAQAVARVPVNRHGTPADIAHAVSFFAGENTGYVSGQILYVSGGPLG